MKLRDFMETFKSREIKVSVIDAGEDLIKFFSEGWAGVESDILDRNISKWEMTSATSISVYLEGNEP
jgi:hypothetical protein